MKRNSLRSSSQNKQSIYDALALLLLQLSFQPFFPTKYINYVAIYSFPSILEYHTTTLVVFLPSQLDSLHHICTTSQDHRGEIARKNFWKGLIVCSSFCNDEIQLLYLHYLVMLRLLAGKKKKKLLDKFISLCHFTTFTMWWDTMSKTLKVHRTLWMRIYQNNFI